MHAPVVCSQLLTCKGHFYLYNTRRAVRCFCNLEGKDVYLPACEARVHAQHSTLPKKTYLSMRHFYKNACNTETPTTACTAAAHIYIYMYMAVHRVNRLCCLFLSINVTHRCTYIYIYTFIYIYMCIVFSWVHFLL